MTKKHWNDQELAKVSADLDAELEQLFDEMETVLTSMPEDQAGPTLGFLPDDDDMEPPRARRLRSSDDAPVLARPNELGDDDFEARAASIAPAGDLVDGHSPAARRPKRQRASFERPVEQDLPEAEILPDDYDEPGPLQLRSTISDLSPEDFSSLMERAVARGVLAALKKWQKTPH